MIHMAVATRGGNCDTEKAAQIGKKSGKIRA